MRYSGFVQLAATRAPPCPTFDIVGTAGGLVTVSTVSKARYSGATTNLRLRAAPVSSVDVTTKRAHPWSLPVLFLRTNGHKPRGGME
jgi:hypothetical protein